MKKYDKFASHELHLFVYFKDTEFFDLVVKPHIKNKLEKDFIDYFLLDDKKKLREFLRPDFIRENAHEQVLLLLSLKDEEDCKENCQAFFEMMKMKDSKRKYDITDFKLKYDTVVNSQKSKDDIIVGGPPPPPAPSGPPLTAEQEARQTAQLQNLAQKMSNQNISLHQTMPRHMMQQTTMGMTNVDCRDSNQIGGVQPRAVNMNKSIRGHKQHRT